MTFWNTLTPWDKALWFLTITSEAVLLFEIFLRKLSSKAIIWTVYVVFILLSDLVNLTVGCVSPLNSFGYWYCFWWLKVTAEFLQAMLAVRLTAEILPDIATLVKIYSIGFISALAYTCTRSLPTGYTSTMLLISGNADYVCGLILMLLAIRPSAKWPKEYRGIIVGLLWSLASHLGCTVWHSHTTPQHFWMVRLAYPAASLITMGIWLTGVIVSTRNKPLAKYSDIGYSSRP